MSEQQTVQTTPQGKNRNIILLIIVSTVLLGIAFIIFITVAYTFHWSGTGFTSSQKPTMTTEITQSNAKKVTTTVEDQPAKTLWDWLPLLAHAHFVWWLKALSVVE